MTADPALAAPDAELDRLLLDYGHARERVGQWSEKDIQWSTAELKRSMQVAVAIHAYVEKVTREARAEGERAATGEVVGTGRVYRDLHSSMHVVPEQWHIPQDAVHPVHGIPVRVVRRAIEDDEPLHTDAPRVWVAMDQNASAWFHARPVHYAQDAYDGEWRWVEDQPSGGYYPAPSWLVEALGLTPGTVRRYALVPHPEGEET